MNEWLFYFFKLVFHCIQCTGAERISKYNNSHIIYRKMSSSSRKYLVRVFVTFGHLAVSVTLRDVIVPICSHQMKTDGFGLDLVRKSDLPANGTLATGVIRVDMVKHNPTIVKLPKETMNRVYRFWIISTVTVLSGMTLLAIIWNHSFAKIPMSYWTLFAHEIQAFDYKRESLTPNFTPVHITHIHKNLYPYSDNSEFLI